LEATLIGCINIRYPHKTYLLDDGDREEVKALAESFGCGYLTRQDHSHAKAGNINAALKNTSGDFIAIMDADMVPQPDYLEKTLGYFRDPKTAIVQLPQEFYNTDSVQHVKTGANWHEQQLFYHVIQPGKNNINAPFWCGSPSIVRRTALESVGGVATESITEDFLTSIKLNSAGWNIKYHHEALAFGIAPQTLFAFNVQRFRWAQGAMKILKSHYNPLIAKNLTFKQRVAHFAAIFTYFDSYQKLIFFIIPVTFLASGILPIRFASGIEFFGKWSLYYMLIMLTNIALGRGYFKYLEVEKYNTLKMFTFIKASFSLVSTKKQTFRVTPKSVDDTIKQKERRELKTQIVLLVVVFLAVLAGAVKILLGLYQSAFELGAMLVSIFWCLFNSLVLILSLYDVLKRLYNRRDHRFPVQIDIKITDDGGNVFDGHVHDISQSGVGVRLAEAAVPGDDVRVGLALPDGLLELGGTVAYKKPLAGGAFVGIQFSEMTESQKTALFYFLYVTTPRRIYDETHKKKGRSDIMAP
jgi:cellulose synthase (UDP-forming)